MTTATLEAKDFKGEVHPDWCPGCGHFGVLNILQRALAELGLQQNEVAVISGIGCSSNLPGFINTYGMPSAIQQDNNRQSNRRLCCSHR